MNEANRQDVPNSAAPSAPGKSRPLTVAPDWRQLFNPQWPEAEWDVSGAFTFDQMLLGFHDFILKKTNRKPFSQVHGAPTCKWTGGRLKTNIFAQDKIDGLIQAYSARGIAVHATFTNYNITESLLSDSLGNLILDSLHRHNQTGNNGVILSEKILYDYVRARYPELKLIASITKIAKENGRGDPDYYRNLESAYDRVMVHPDDNLQPSLLAQLENKGKYEILINEPCLRNCQQRKYHYQMLSDGHTNFLDYSMEKRLAAHLARNDCGNLLRLTTSPAERTLVLSSSEVKAIYDLGFRHFKIQGRGMPVDNAILFELARWLFTHDPELDYLVPRLLMAFMSPAP